jgi:hypothetical protein
MLQNYVCTIRQPAFPSFPRALDRGPILIWPPRDAMFGVVCRILLLSSLALGTRNRVTLELATPSTAAPDGLLLCADDRRYAWAAADVALAALQEAGTPWDAAGAERVAGVAPDWRGAPWLRPAASWGLRPIEAGAAADFLGRDPYYAASHAARRCGASRAPIAAVPACAPACARMRPHAPSHAPACGAHGPRWRRRFDDLAADQDGAALPAAMFDAALPGANCLLITGARRD